MTVSSDPFACVDERKAQCKAAQSEHEHERQPDHPVHDDPQFSTDDTAPRQRVAGGAETCY